MVDDQDEILSHYQCPPMESVLDTLEEFYETADSQDSRFVHGFVEALVETEDSPHRVANVES